MKRATRWGTALLALVLALGFAACAKKPAQEPPAPEQPPEQPPEVLPYVRPEVENNGGYFVRIGKMVWFRYYDEGAFDETQLWGNFLTLRPGHAVSSKLCYYDEEGDAIMEAAPDDGYGALWFGTDGFYLTRAAEDGADEVYYKTLDGAETVLCGGWVQGVSENGRFAAISAPDGKLRVYDGTEELHATGVSATYCGVSDDGTLVYLRDGENQEALLCSLDAGGRERSLGTVPAPENPEPYAYPTIPMLEQCLIDGEEVWCSFGYYEGTGHFLYDTVCVRARLNTDDSLTVVEERQTSDEPYVPKMYRDEDGKVRLVKFLPGELALSGGTWGDLIRYDNGSVAGVLVEDLIPTDPYNAGGMIVQTMESAGDAAYLIVARAYRDPEMDVGWRTAYAPGTFYYLRVPFAGDAETLYGPNWEAARSALREEAEDPYAAFAGKWSMVAAETEGERSDTLPDGMWETLEFLDTRRVVQEGAEPDGTAYRREYIFSEVLPTNGVSENAGTYGLMLTGVDTEDIIYAYLENGALVATEQMLLQTEQGRETISRSGFYERVE